MSNAMQDVETVENAKPWKDQDGMHVVHREFTESSKRLAALVRELMPDAEVAEAAKRLKMMHDGQGRTAYGDRYIEQRVKRDEAAVICHAVPTLLKLLEGT